jgi:hypothetical protein
MSGEKILIRKSSEKKTLGRPSCRMENNIKISLRKIRDSNELAQNMIRGRLPFLTAESQNVI